MFESMATFLQKARLLKGFLTGEIAYAGPFFVTIDVICRCNLQCLGCRFHSPEATTPSVGDQSVQDIPFDLVEKLCRELRTMDTEKLILIGEGEPLLHPRLFDMISTAKASGFHVSLVTNGTLFSKDRVQSLLSCRLDKIQVSLWASSPERYEQNSPGTNPDTFEKVVSGLTFLSSLKTEQKSKRPYVILHHPLHRYNFQRIDGIVDLALKTGCDAISLSPFYSHRGRLNSYAMTPEDENNLFQSLTQMRKRLRTLPLNHNIDQTLLRYRIGDAVWKKLPCYIDWIDSRVKVDGTVLPCNPCQWPMGNLKENNLHEIWNSSSYRYFRRQTCTREGLAVLNQQCDCQYCCHLPANIRLHQFFRWLSPFTEQSKKGLSCSDR
jgi:MoaA/NifB/PqqE/SkfB family radical SAM enzyme